MILSPYNPIDIRFLKIIILNKIMTNNNKTRGYVMFGAGFFLILMNAISYATHDSTSPAMGIIGLVFVAVGMRMVRSS